METFNNGIQVISFVLIMQMSDNDDDNSVTMIAS